MISWKKKEIYLALYKELDELMDKYKYEKVCTI